MGVLENVFNLVENFIDYHRETKLTKKQEIIMVLMRFCLGLLEQDLAYRFDIAQSSVSRII